jgi:Clr5 domain
MGGRAAIDLEAYREYIVQQITGGTTVKRVVEILERKFGVETSERTLYRRFKEWDVKQNIRLVWSDELFKRLNELYFQDSFDNEKILKQLVEEGFVLSKWHVVQLEHVVGIYRRNSVSSPLSDDMLREILVEKMNEGSIETLGRGLLQARFRREGLAVGRYVYN